MRVVRALLAADAFDWPHAVLLDRAIDGRNARIMMAGMPDQASAQLLQNSAAQRGLALRLPDRAAHPPPWPLVVIVAGAAADGGSEDALINEEIASALAAWGLGACISSADALMANASIVSAAAGSSDLPAAIIKIRASLGNLVSHAEINDQRLGLVGRGSGAILAAALSKGQPALQRLCLIAPIDPATLDDERNHSGLPSEIHAQLAQLGPFEALRESSMPLLIIHGAADRRVPLEQALPYAAAAQRSGRRVDHVLVALADHEFTVPPVRVAVIERIVEFLAPLAAVDLEPAERG
jgi:dienelactone hydrolase